MRFPIFLTRGVGSCGRRLRCHEIWRRASDITRLSFYRSVPLSALRKRLIGDKANLPSCHTLPKRSLLKRHMNVSLKMLNGTYLIILQIPLLLRCKWNSARKALSQGKADQAFWSSKELEYNCLIFPELSKEPPKVEEEVDKSSPSSKSVFPDLMKRLAHLSGRRAILFSCCWILRKLRIKKDF